MDEVWYVIPVWVLRVGRDSMWYGRWVVALCVGEGERVSCVWIDDDYLMVHVCLGVSIYGVWLVGKARQ